MKAIILCDGSYEKLLPITYTIPKELFPVANKPLIIYTIELLLGSGIEEIGIVVNKYSELLFKKTINKYFSRDFKYIIQDSIDKVNYQPFPIDEFIENKDLLMILGNSSLELDLNKLLEKPQENEINCKLLLKEVEHPELYNVAYIVENKIIDLEKRPKVSFSNLAIAGIYFFSNSIVKTFKENMFFRDGSDIIDFIKFILHNGYDLDYEILDNYGIEIKTPSDILEDNINRLDSMDKYKKGEIINSHISGKVIVAEGAVIYNSMIRGPVIIDEKSIIKNSYIGPYTSIGKSVKIEKSSIENSIVLNNCIIFDVKNMIDSSIVGEKSIIKGENGFKTVNRLIVGRETKVYLRNN